MEQVNLYPDLSSLSADQTQALLDIYNKALQLLAIPQITREELLDDTHKISSEMSRTYLFTLRRLYKIYNWSFLETKTYFEPLIPKPSEPKVEMFGYKYKYAIATSLPLQNILHIETILRSSVENFLILNEEGYPHIYCNEPALLITYSFIEENLLLIPKYMHDLLAYALAAEVAFVLTGSKEIEQRLIVQVYGSPTPGSLGGLSLVYADKDSLTIQRKKIQFASLLN